MRTSKCRFFRNDGPSAQKQTKWTETTDDEQRAFHGVTFDNGPPVFGGVCQC